MLSHQVVVRVYCRLGKSCGSRAEDERRRGASRHGLVVEPDPISFAIFSEMQPRFEPSRDFLSSADVEDPYS